MEPQTVTGAMPPKANPSQMWAAHFRPDRLSLLMAAIAVLGAALVLWRMLAFGAVLSTDSAHYIAAARSLLSAEDFLGYDGYPYGFWPPPYPLLLATLALIQADRFLANGRRIPGLALHSVGPAP